MPTYEYRCHECEHQFEVFQKMSDDPVSECEECGGAVRRMLFPVAIHFKGSGFYTTDYARKKTLSVSSGNGSSDSGGSGGEGASDSDRPNGNGSSATSGAAGSDGAAAKKNADASAKKESVVSSKTGDS